MVRKGSHKGLAGSPALGSVSVGDLDTGPEPGAVRPRTDGGRGLVHREPTPHPGERCGRGQVKHSAPTSDQGGAERGPETGPGNGGRLRDVPR